MKHLILNNKYIDSIEDLKSLLDSLRQVKTSSQLVIDVVDSFVDGDIEEFLRDVGEDGLATRIKNINSTSDSLIIEALIGALCNETYKVEFDLFQFIEVITTSLKQNSALFEVKVKKNAVESLDITIRIPQLKFSKTETIKLNQHQLGETISFIFAIPEQTEVLEVFDVEFLIGEMVVKTEHQINKQSICVDGAEDCILTMVHIPGTRDLPGFYISETPVTIQQYKALATGDDLNEWLDYYEEFGTREYEEFTVAAALSVDFVLDFVNKIKQPIIYRLPTREQWLHMAENYYERVKWCVDRKFLGMEHEAIAWEMMQNNSYDIYCLLGVAYENGKRVIKGNNFCKEQERDNIAFRLVCSESEINTYYKNGSYENR